VFCEENGGIQKSGLSATPSVSDVPAPEMVRDFDYQK